MSWRTRLVCSVCLLAACACAAYAITDSEAIQAVRDFESQPSLTVVVGHEWQKAYGFNGFTRAVREGSTVLPSGVKGDFSVIQDGSTTIEVAMYFDDERPGSSVSAEGAQVVGIQFAETHFPDYNSQTWVVDTETDRSLGDFIVRFQHELANGVKTTLGSCAVWVSPSTGYVTGYRYYAGQPNPSAAEPPSLTVEQAATSAATSYDALTGLQPAAAELDVTEDGVLAWYLTYDLDTESEAVDLQPHRVVVDANAGSIINASFVASSHPPRTEAPITAAESLGTETLGLVVIGLSALLLIWLLAYALRRRRPAS